MPLPSHALGSSAPALLDETLGQNLRRTVEAFADREALVVVQQKFRCTYRELWHLVTKAARGLLARGVQVGDRVGIWSPNRFEWVVLQYATARVGAILVNINPAYRATELEFVLNQSGISLLCLAERFRLIDYVGTLAEVRPRCPGLRTTVNIDCDWQDFLEGGQRVSLTSLEAIEAGLRPGDAINIQYTSGTTGFPKGATLSHRNILNNAYLTTGLLGYSERDRVCLPVPFYHCFGMVVGTLGCVTRGACLVVPSEAFDPLAVLEAVQNENCTSLYGVPTMFIAELNHSRFVEFDLSSLRTGLMGGAPCPVEVMNRVRSQMHMSEVGIICGMTETSPVSTQTHPADPIDRRVQTVGQVHPHAEIKIIDSASGVTLPRGMPGEQCTRGYLVMLGYWNDPAGTAHCIDRDGWMHTGDLAIMDDEGYVRIVGRLKDMIIRGGENIYPREVEEYLLTHPDVADAHVIGVPCPRYGEEVMAWVKPREGARLSSELLRTHCSGRIASFKIPKHWKVVDSFPMTITGKVQKYRMRELATAELGRGPDAQVCAG